jgi:hypothetical protein
LSALWPKNRRSFFGLLKRQNCLQRSILFVVLAAAGACGQAPKIGTIDFYGLRKVPEAKVRKALGTSEGGQLSGSKGDLEDRIAEIPGVVQAHLEAACCDDTGQAILYVGVEERGAIHFDLRTPPEGDAALPEEMLSAYREFLSAVAQAARRSPPAEDLTRGHSLMADPDVRAIQERFVDLVARNLAQVRTVLRTSADDEQRAMAAYLIGYAPRKKDIVDDLQYALKDSDDAVRGNAIRALAAVAVYATLHPDAEVKVSPTWFIEMLNSLSWTDRNNAAVALVNLTESRDASVLAQLKQRALPALNDMARWRHLAHALPAYILLGRVKGIPEKEIQDAWASGDREKVLQK